MNNKLLEDIFNNINQLSDLKSESIPSLELYMDQIITLFDTELSNHKKNEDDKIITKTMINNYSKAGLIKPIKGKKYSKDRVLQILIIYILKNTLSMQEIGYVLKNYHDDNELENVYDDFLHCKNIISKDTTEHLLELFKNNNLDISNQDDALKIILILSSLSNSLKQVAEEIVLSLYGQDD